jgi:hypothetical protein
MAGRAVRIEQSHFCVRSAAVKDARRIRLLDRRQNVRRDVQGSSPLEGGPLALCLLPSSPQFWGLQHLPWAD